MSTLTQEEAHRFFEYRDGVLYWKERPVQSRKPKGDMEAGTKSGNGYKKVKVKKTNFYVHQIIFLMHHGYIPECTDHIDNDKNNNKIENLRAATKQQNNCNRKLGIPNVLSKVCGVIPSANGKRWCARVQHKGKSIHLGTFDELELAHLVASEARNLYHGEFAYYVFKGA